MFNAQIGNKTNEQLEHEFSQLQEKFENTTNDEEREEIIARRNSIMYQKNALTRAERGDYRAALYFNEIAKLYQELATTFRKEEREQIQNQIKELETKI